MSRHEDDFIRQHRAERWRLAWARVPLALALLALALTIESAIQLSRYLEAGGRASGFMGPAVAAVVRSLRSVSVASTFPPEAE